MNIAIWVHPLKSLPTNDLECRQTFPYIFVLNPEVLYALTLARISLFAFFTALTLFPLVHICSSLVCNTSTGIYLMLYKSQADIRGTQTVDSYLNTSAGIETKDFQSPSTHAACASHRCRVYRLLHEKVSAQGSQQKPAVSRISTH